MSNNLAERMDVVESRLSEGDESFAELRRDVSQMRGQLDRVADDLSQVKEIVVAWDSIKGFVAVVKASSKVLGFLLKVAAVVGALWLFAKTGEWKWPQ
nr:MAG: hypothetical protein DIU57_21465 [Pseudomonadota bacterium]